jgi:hypothetical protein
LKKRTDKYCNSSQQIINLIVTTWRHNVRVVYCRELGVRSGSPCEMYNSNRTLYKINTTNNKFYEWTRPWTSPTHHPSVQTTTAVLSFGNKIITPVFIAIIPSSDLDTRHDPPALKWRLLCCTEMWERSPKNRGGRAPTNCNRQRTNYFNIYLLKHSLDWLLINIL